jgi:predicted acyl esterase
MYMKSVHRSDLLRVSGPRMPSPVQLALKAIDVPKIGRNNYQGFKPGEEVLPQGWNGYGSRPLPCNIHVTHDFGIKVRDGCTLYMDIYRPEGLEPGKTVPAIVCWSPFGKKFNGITMLQNLPWHLGIANGVLSGLEKFEGPDPAEFVPKGFAIVNVDARGSGDSDGAVTIMGTQEAEDGYDVIEALAKLPWCNGNIGLAGNSHLAIIQWFIAALKPPSLKAIAPWEACADLYREQFVRGGIFDAGLFDFIIKHNIQGHAGVENFQEMYRRTQKGNSKYWEDKRANISAISIPTYITASYTSFVHTMGSIRGYLQVNSPHKWLRICPWQEWYDMWNDKKSSAELAQFFDHFLNNTENGWEKTPRVRTTVLRFSEDPLFDIEEEDYPIPRTVYKKLYFSGDNKLALTPTPTPTATSYHSEKYLDHVGFRYIFEERTRLVGLPKAVLYMSTPDSNDMDVYVLIRKLDKQGKPLINLNIPWSSIADQGVSPSAIEQIPKRNMNNLMFHVGSLGILRASRRAIETSLSIHENYPFHPHDKDEFLQPGEIVKLEIGIWAMGVEYEAGESINVEIHGTSPLLRGEFDDVLNDPFTQQKSKGMHTVHFGGEYPSHIILPFV